jgi:apolipoprotein N-acyltransferase
LPFLEELSINNGGTSGTLGIEKEPKVLSTAKIKFAPSICYESIYGEFIGTQCKKGAQVIFIITNDGWWGNTPGYKQHMSFARLRAIENRRSIARSANTGTSCFINQKGDVIEQSTWWQPTALKQKINLNNDISFYSTFGDLLGKFLGFMSIGLLFATVFRYFKRG